MFKLSNILIYIILFFCFFPFLKILPIDADTQPNALIFAAIYIALYSNKVIPKQFLYLLIPCLSSIFIYILSDYSFSSARSTVNYISIFVLSLATYRGLVKLGGLPITFYKISVLIWFIVGTVQQFFYPSFMEFIIPRGDSAITLLTGRGIVCLSPEPTHYGLICLMLFLIGRLNFPNYKGLNVYYTLLFFQLLIYSKSTLAIFSLIISLILYLVIKIFFFSKNNFRNIIICFSIIIFIYFGLDIFNDYISQYRIGKLAILLMQNPLEFIFLDVSVNDRFNHVFFSMYGFIENWGVPRGYNSFLEYIKILKTNSQFSSFFPAMVGESDTPRIMSSIGGAFFELGVFALPIVSFILYTGKRIVANNNDNIFVILLFVIIMFNPMPFAVGMVGLLFGNLLFVAKNNNICYCKGNHLEYNINNHLCTS